MSREKITVISRFFLTSTLVFTAVFSCNINNNKKTPPPKKKKCSYNFLVHYSRCFFLPQKPFLVFLRYFLRTNPRYAMSQKMSSFYIWSKTLLKKALFLTQHPQGPLIVNWKSPKCSCKKTSCSWQWGLCCPSSSSPSGCPSAAVWKEGPVQKISLNASILVQEK